MKRGILYSLTILGLINAAVATHDDFFLDEEYRSGLVNLTNGDDMFYWLFDSKNDVAKDPLVMWLTGGPGCASEIALFYENGPYKINNNLTLTANAQTWNQVSNLIYIDQPIGTGFSKCSNIFHLDTTEEEIAANLKSFIDGFLVANPEFKGRDFFITGESYAGHYIPAIAYYFTKNVTDLGLNFKGIAIGNGWVDPYEQYPAYAEFAYENNLISTTQYYMLKAGFATCQAMINSYTWIYALEVCQLTMTYIVGNPLAPAFNLYDIREKCDKPPMCYDMSNADKLMNDPTIQAKLGVSGRSWVECSNSVHTALLGDWILNLAPKISAVLESGLDVLVYSGDKDFVCNWRGGEAWTNAVEWSGQSEFKNTPYKEWTVNGKPAGQLKKVNNFKFLRIYDAGHMVPMDQPEVALSMLQAFMMGTITVDLQ